jgi:hypothetical protein
VSPLVRGVYVQLCFFWREAAHLRKVEMLDGMCSAGQFIGGV